MESSNSSSCNNNNNKRFYSSLHANRKPLIMKKPIAPLPPTKPRVYKVNPAEFKEVVQRLTAAASDQPRPRPRPRRLDDIAPPPLDLMISTTTAAAAAAARSTQNFWSTTTTTTDINNNNNGMMKTMTGGFEDEDVNKKTSAAAVVTPPRESYNKSHNKYLESCGALSPLGFNFSPSAMNWPFSPLLSPGTLSSLDHATVL